MLSSRQTIFLSVATLFVLILGVLVNKLNLNVSDITEREKCPACFGVSFCQEIDDNKVHFEYSDFYSIFNNLFGVKNVYFGKYKDKKVVMKKLAHNYEFTLFDDFVCSNDQLNELCFVENKRTNTNTKFYQMISLELLNAKFDDPNVKFRLCPTIVNFDELLKINKTQDLVKDENHYKYLWTLIKINPEPIILQSLKSENGWPTPNYFGECGRLIIEEYVGFPLSTFSEEPWIKRAEIAASLLNAAYMFTFKNSKFAFYLTDVSVDNIAINNKYEAIFVDLENVIVVDKDPPKEVWSNISAWNRTHISEIHTNCQDCFTFSPDDICNHRISDHNYFAVCHHILGQNTQTNVQSLGFLYDPPDEILKKYSTLTSLIRKCSKPDRSYSRIMYGIELQKILNSIVKYKKQL